MDSLLDKRVVDTFEEKCSETITNFMKDLRNYNREKWGCDFREYALNAARATSAEIHTLHYYALMEISVDINLDTFKRLLDVMKKSLAIIDDIMIYRNYYNMCMLHINCKYNDTI